MGGVDGKRLEGKGVKRVWLGCRRGREERREEQRGKFWRWTNGRSVWLWRTRKVFIVKDKIVRKRGANGKRRRVGLWRNWGRGRGKSGGREMIGGGGIW